MTAHRNLQSTSSSLLAQCGLADVPRCCHQRYRALYGFLHAAPCVSADVDSSGNPSAVVPEEKSRGRGLAWIRLFPGHSHGLPLFAVSWLLSCSLQRTCRAVFRFGKQNAEEIQERPGQSVAEEGWGVTALPGLQGEHSYPAKQKQEAGPQSAVLLAAL